MILVTGSTGNVGGEAVRALVAAGAPVRALVRGDAPAPSQGVEYVKGDLNSPASLEPALAGATGLFLLPGYPGMQDLLARANQAGVSHVVLLSGTSADSGDMSNAVTKYMVESENAVRSSGIPWTILRPSGFMTNTLQWIPQLAKGDVVRAPFAGVPIANLDPADIGAVAAVSFLEDGHLGQTYRLTGPEALLPADRLRILGSALGRELQFVAQSDDEAHAEMLGAMPEAYVDAFFDFYVKGSLDESIVLPTVQEVTGRPANSFEQWATAHADSFRQMTRSCP